MEVLISVVILSIGLLGLAGLQTSGLRNSQGAYYRTQATQLANSMADSIRANMTGFNSGAYGGTGAQHTSCETNGGCSPQDMAEHDLFLWGQALTALPAGQGVVANNAGVVTLTIRWDNDNTGAAGLGCGNDHTVDLTCLAIVFQP